MSSADIVVRFKDVNFAYEDGITVLENINLELERVNLPALSARTAAAKQR